MKTWHLFAAMGGVFGLLALAATSRKRDDRPSGANLPQGRASFVLSNPTVGVPLPVPMLDGEPLPVLRGDNDSERLALYRDFQQTLQNEFTAKRATLPPDANRHTLDGYSGGLWPLPTWIAMPNPTAQQILTANWRLYDEYGRAKPGHVGFGGSMWDSFARLLANPLASATIAAAAFAVGGPAGLAAYGAVNAYVVRGEELTAKSVFLTAARSYAVSQCGPACGAAFDIGVGVASGKSVDVAAEEALLNQMSPSERLAYDEGRKAYEELL